MKIYIGLILGLVVTLVSYGQDNRLDSLRSLISVENEVNKRGLLLDELAKEWAPLNIDSSIYFYKKAIQNHIATNEMFLTTKSVKNLSDHYYSQGRLDAMFHLNKHYFSFFQENDYALGYLKMAGELGSYYNAKGDLDSSKYYDSFIIEKAQINDSVQCTMKVSSLINLAVLDIERGEFSEAKINLDKAKEIADTAVYYNLYLLYSTFGMLDQNIGDKENALANHTLALEIAHKSNYTVIVANAYFTLGAYHLIYNEFELAEKNSLLGYNIVKDIGQEYFMLHFHKQLSEIYLKSGQKNKAKASALFILNNAMNFGLKDEYEFANLILGRIAIQNNNYTKALEYCEGAWNYFQSSSFLDYNRNACECLSNANEGLGEKEEALYFYKKYVSYSDSLNNKEDAKKTLELKNKYELEVAKAKEDLLAFQKLKVEEDLNISENTLKKQRRKSLLISLLLVAVLILLVVVFWLFRLKQKANEKLKRENEQKELLLKEVNHRVKNNMQMVSSLLELQMFHVSDEQTKKSLQEGVARINALGFAHQELYKRDDITYILLGEYLKLIVNSLIKKSDIEVNIVVPKDFRMHIEKAQALGFIVNELVTNSIKYAWENEHTKKEIKISLDNASDIIVFLYSDNGTGFPENYQERKSTSLGTSLIKSFVERQLNGQLNVYNDNGAKTQISFNLTDVL